MARRLVYINILMAPYYIHKYLCETSTSRVLEIGGIPPISVFKIEAELRLFWALKIGGIRPISAEFRLFWASKIGGVQPIFQASKIGRIPPV